MIDAAVGRKRPSADTSMGSTVASPCMT